MHTDLYPGGKLRKGKPFHSNSTLTHLHKPLKLIPLISSELTSFTPAHITHHTLLFPANAVAPHQQHQM
ncbi:hypothetical protein CROQUDRAFT_95294 [Cronartium quercuum f. sp. fusiforme G11]|uniref:Uncharacterized protein n=1 Tax=Cronartium quercuum f. sp. fusiforme G11 TaxID=708437 RepID=A0A9P6NDV2_9BASI|nr:hypothetical protein CROQUDRAFT_95294 [Cronartium quercuum f. sp. fusiforme G11]